MNNSLITYFKKQIFTVFDVGARGGFKDLKAIHRLVNLYGFEPEEKSFEVLIKQKHNFNRTQFYRLALSDDENEQKFNIGWHKDMSSFLQPDFDNFDRNFGFIPDNERWRKSLQQIETSNVQCTTFDSFCQKNHIKSIDFAKIDVQGYEDKVLQGANNLLENQKIGVLKIEVSFIPIYQNQPHFSEIDILMRTRGYVLLDLLFFRDEINRMNNSIRKDKIYEKPRYCLVADAIYYPKCLINLNEREKIRIAFILASMGYLSNSFKILENYFEKNEIEQFFESISLQKSLLYKIKQKLCV